MDNFIQYGCLILNYLFLTISYSSTFFSDSIAYNFFELYTWLKRHNPLIIQKGNNSKRYRRYNELIDKLWKIRYHPATF